MVMNSIIVRRTFPVSVSFHLNACSQPYTCNTFQAHNVPGIVSTIPLN